MKAYYRFYFETHFKLLHLRLHQLEAHSFIIFTLISKFCAVHCYVSCVGVFSVLCSLLPGFLYGALFLTEFQQSILPLEDVEARFSSGDRTNLDYSFYMVVVAVVCYVLNIVVLVCSEQNLSCTGCKRGETKYNLDTELGGTSILY